jgi:hypothetical protein
VRGRLGNATRKVKGTSRFVPYITAAVLPEARPYLPHGPDAALTATDVDRFVTDTAHLPGTRMAVLGVLRAHGANGAEVGISVAALLISALGLAFNLLKVAAQADGWLQAIPILEAVAIVLAASFVIHVAVAAHIRKMTAVTWLGAYQDALAAPVAASSRRRWLQPRGQRNPRQAPTTDARRARDEGAACRGSGDRHHP